MGCICQFLIPLSTLLSLISRPERRSFRSTNLSRPLQPLASAQRGKRKKKNFVSKHYSLSTVPNPWSAWWRCDRRFRCPANPLLITLIQPSDDESDARDDASRRRQRRNASLFIRALMPHHPVGVCPPGDP
ncbi:hypothetical protein CDAR_319861 [Caerostris darwini]|uniref:Secreted protein n=1 Tax=Caerostris darwini TaxID=1538125 RepID=A0AAV4M7K7_9ARAC|nr:hypothetical protein CDAR_319861 [Caerostris darwini]